MESLDLQALASLATALGVFFAAAQLWITRRHARTAFEDDLSREYRDIAHRLPVAALLGDKLSEEEQRIALKEFYHYIDLTNDQVFLRANRRVSKAAWLNWADGIQTNLGRLAFRAAWEEIKVRAPNSFDELRRLEREGFRTDPRWWIWRSRGTLRPDVAPSPRPDPTGVSPASPARALPADAHRDMG
jgi:hypothetical protein